MDRVRQSIDPNHYQVHDLYVLQERPAREVAARVGVRAALVYLIKHRVSARLRTELRRLEAETNPPNSGRAR